VTLATPTGVVAEMGVWGWRAVRVLTVACVVLFGGEAWAQPACSALNGTSVGIPSSGAISVASIGVTYSVGPKVTVMITGATGGSGTISFGGGSTGWAGPGSYTVTTTSSLLSDTVRILGTGQTVAGTAAFMCNSLLIFPVGPSAATQNSTRGLFVIE